MGKKAVNKFLEKITKTLEVLSKLDSPINTTIRAGERTFRKPELYFDLPRIGEIPNYPREVRIAPGDGEVNISWISEEGIWFYNVYMADKGGSDIKLTKDNYRTMFNGFKFFMAVECPDECTDYWITYTRSDLTNGTKYHFIVTAHNTSGESDDSYEVWATPGSFNEIPKSPTDVKAETSLNGKQITIRWDDAVNGVTSYNIYAATEPGITKDNYKELGGIKISGVSTPYFHTDLIPDTKYYFVVAAVNSKGETESEEIWATSESSFPDTPQITEAVPGNGEVKISWTYINNADAYIIYISTETEGIFDLKEVSNAETSYTFKGLTNGVTYTFTVEAFNSVGSSDGSNEVSAAPVSDTVRLNMKLTLLGRDQAPIRYAKVKISASDDPDTLLGEGFTDQNGQTVIQVPFIPNASYLAKTEATGYQTTTYKSDFVTGESADSTDMEGYIFLYEKDASAQVKGLIIEGGCNAYRIPGKTFVYPDDGVPIFTGTANEVGNIPIPKAHYEFYRGEKLASSGETDADGMYNLLLSPGLYRLEVTYPGVDNVESYMLYAFYSETNTGNVPYYFYGGYGCSRRIIFHPDSEDCPCCEQPLPSDFFSGHYDPDNDGINTRWELDNGLNPCNSGDANLDADNDGLTNMEEFTLGTNPNSDNNPMPVIIAGIEEYYVSKNENTVLSVKGYNPTEGHLTLKIVEKPANGILFDPVGLNIVYKPNTNYVGSDIFTFRLRDISGIWSQQPMYGTVTDRSVSQEGSFKIKVVPVWNEKTETLKITTIELPDGYGGQPYNAQMSASGGVPPYKWETHIPKYNPFEYPFGCYRFYPEINTNTGSLSGIPDICSRKGILYFVVTDSIGQTAEKTVEFTVTPDSFAECPECL